MVRTWLGRLIRSAIGARGHLLVNPDFHWGVSAFADIRRLARSQGWQVQQVVDVGAHFGEWAETALNAFPDARVTSFEPFPESFRELQSRHAGNSRLQAVNVAASNQQAELQFYLYENSCLNSLTNRSAWTVKADWNSTASITVPAVRLDKWCQQAGVSQVDVLKVDTEGFDLQVLEGAAELLQRRGVKFVYVEFNDLQPGDQVTGGALLPIDDYLRPFGFRFINTYLDNVGTQGQLFVTSNALFMLQP